MAKGKSVPKKAIDRPDKKVVEIEKQPVDNRPVWRFSTTDKGGYFKWPKGMSEEGEIVKKLHEFDSMSWQEIEGKQHHYLSPNSLSKEATQRLEELKLDDEIEHLFSFHLQGKPRIIAIRHLNVAELLWFDPQHKVSPSEKKRT